jgi:hypothetical protein
MISKVLALSFVVSFGMSALGQTASDSGAIKENLRMATATSLRALHNIAVEIDSMLVQMGSESKISGQPIQENTKFTSTCMSLGKMEAMGREAKTLATLLLKSENPAESPFRVKDQDRVLLVEIGDATFTDFCVGTPDSPADPSQKPMKPGENYADLVQSLKAQLDDVDKARNYLLLNK